MSTFAAARPAPFAAVPFLLRHALLIPASLGLAAYAVQALGIDFALASTFFDPALKDFPARALGWLELLGHRLAKSLLLGLWMALLAAAIASRWICRLHPHRTLLWTTTAAMAIGPLAVVLLKDINAHHCPWDLKRFGGTAEFTAAWFVPRAEAGRCFPGGHAAGGFSLVALYFAGVASGSSRLRLAGLVAALIAGASFSAVRMMQGAHFLSHNLWSAAVVWSLAAIAFAPFTVAGERIAGGGGQPTPPADPACRFSC